MGRMTDEQARGRAAELGRAALQAKGLTRLALSQAAGVDKGTVTAFLNGQRWPTQDKRDRMEDALGLPRGAFQAAFEGSEPDGSSAPSAVPSRVPSSAAQEERGELSGKRIVRVHIATMAHDIDIQTTLDDGEDRAAVIAEIMGTLGLEGDASRGGSSDGGS